MKTFLKKYLLAVNTLAFFITIFSCSTPKEINKNQITISAKIDTIPKYELIAKEKFSGDLLYIPNSNNTYMLCISNNKPTNENPFPNFSFFIYDLKNETIIYEDTYENGNVNWKNNEQIMIHTFPGQVRNDNDQPVVYIYDLKKRKKYIDEIIKDK